MNKQNNILAEAACEEFQKALYITQEEEESVAGTARAVLVNNIVEARKKEGITQRQLEVMSGVKQPIISRMERGTTDPKLSTVLKILGSFGKTLQIVPLQENKKQEG